MTSGQTPSDNTSEQEECMDKYPLETIPALIAMVDDDIQSGREIKPTRVRNYLISYRLVLRELARVTRECDALKRRGDA